MSSLETMSAAQPAQRRVEEFKPQDYLPLEEFERNGWMVVAGVPPVERTAKIEMKNGNVVNRMKELMTAARKASPSRLFEALHIAYDFSRDAYVAVHKRTPFNETLRSRKDLDL